MDVNITFRSIREMHIWCTVDTETISLFTVGLVVRDVCHGFTKYFLVILGISFCGKGKSTFTQERIKNVKSFHVC